MKFIRFIAEKKEHTGIINKNNVINPLNQDYFKYDTDLLNIDYEKEVNKNKNYNFKDIKIIEPIKPSKIVCVGLNYIEHGEELEMELPDEPKLFLKPSTTIIGQEEKIDYPSMTKQVDYEGELAIVIGAETKQVSPKEAKDHIFGYTIINDVTARDFTLNDGQWVRGKSCDGFAPIGPFIETEMDPLNQRIVTKVDDEIKQDSNTRNMIFSPYEIVSYISQSMTLYPGDLIATGTPPGVGPMDAGSTVEVYIEDIGTLKNYLIKEE